MLTQGALEAAEQLINPLLQRDAAAILKLAPLTGKVIRVRCTVSGMTRSDITGSDIIVPDITVLIWPSAQGLHFERDSSPEPAPAEASIPPIAADAEIEGSFENFARFMLAGERREALLFAGALTLRGDTALVRKLQQITGDLDLDLSALGDQWLDRKSVV